MSLLRSAIAWLALSSVALALDDAALIDGPGYSFSIRAPQGWRMTSTVQLQAAFYPADKTLNKTPVMMYVRSANKEKLGLKTIEEMNDFDLRKIQERHPNAKSQKVGSTRTSDGKEIPIYVFSGGGYYEWVAYSDEPKTFTIFVVTSETEENLRSSEKAFRELISTYFFVSAIVSTPIPK